MAQASSAARPDRRARRHQWRGYNARGSDGGFTSATGRHGHLDKELASDEVAELEALYYLGRDGYLPELFDDTVAGIKLKQAAERDLREQIRHLADKTNLLTCLQTGARMAGRLALAKQLEGM
uniref:DUF3775 domain-containing protein n=1 Tax=Bradyrhizobium quebecense TaxID=2748629 RepID=A0ABS3MVP3_9BRAD